MMAWLQPLLQSLPSIVSSGATLALAVIAYKKLPLIISQIRDSDKYRRNHWLKQKEKSTIEICNKFVMDTVLLDVQRKVFQCRNDDDQFNGDKLREQKREVKHLANYFDLIALGVPQDIYDFDIVYDLLGHIIKDAHDNFIEKHEICPNDEYKQLSFLVRQIQERDASILPTYAQTKAGAVGA